LEWQQRIGFQSAQRCKYNTNDCLDFYGGSVGEGGEQRAENRE
jgi:hypothetical protein